MGKRKDRWDAIANAAGLSVPALVIVLAGCFSPAARASSQSRAAGWGAATAGMGFATVVEAIKGHPEKAVMYGVGAAVSYDQYSKANRDATTERYRSDDPYGYSDIPSWRSDRSEAYARYTSRTREVCGVVVSSTGAFDRSVRVRLDNGETRTIDVPRGTQVRRDRESISVHELRNGERVRIYIERYREDGDIRARRLEVLYDRFRDDRDPERNGYFERIDGRVSSIDSRADILRIESDGRIYIVDTDAATIRDRSGSIRLRDLERGDRVTVEGRRTGDRIRATRVTLR